MPEALPPVEFAFPGPLRDQLVAAIVSGTKTTTSTLLRQYELEGVGLPRIGGRGMVVDSDGRPVVAIETVEVRVVPIDDVPLEHAVAEGEGFATVAGWRDAHLRFWQSPEISAEVGADHVIDGSTPVILERFRIVEPSLRPGGGPGASR